MLSQFFQAQWKHSSPGDWCEQVKLDLLQFGMDKSLDKIVSQSKNAFKTLVKRKALEYAFFSFLEKKNKHSKLENLFYTELKTQKHFLNGEITREQAQNLFSYRVRMANFSENFRGYSGHSPCPLCLAHLDCQAMIFSCPIIKENVTLQGNYKEIFSTNISAGLVKCVNEIENFRKSFIESRMIE